MISFFHKTVYEPLYNALVYLIDVLPGADVGFAIIILTILIKLILFPLSKKALSTQIKMKAIQPELDLIKSKISDRQEQARAMMEIYRRNKLNPFSSILLILIQIPILISLYYIFAQGGLPDIRSDLLYAFVPTPETANMIFLGFIDLAKGNFILALLAGVTQFIQAKYASPISKDNKSHFARSMDLQMKYFLPAMIFVFALTFPGAVALYWTVSNIFSIGQEIVIRRHLTYTLNYGPGENKNDNQGDRKQNVF